MSTIWPQPCFAPGPRKNRAGGRATRGNEWATTVSQYLRTIVPVSPHCSPCSARYSPNGRSIALTYLDPAHAYAAVTIRGAVGCHALGKLAVYEVAAGTIKTIAEPPGGIWVGPISWSPDGNEILVTRATFRRRTAISKRRPAIPAAIHRSAFGQSAATESTNGLSRPGGVPTGGEVCARAGFGADDDRKAHGWPSSRERTSRHGWPWPGWDSAARRHRASSAKCHGGISSGATRSGRLSQIFSISSNRSPTLSRSIPKASILTGMETFPSNFAGQGCAARLVTRADGRRLRLRNYFTTASALLASPAGWPVPGGLTPKARRDKV